MTKKPDAFAYHEVMDRVEMLRQYLNTSLDYHPVIHAHRELQEALSQTEDALQALYSSAAGFAEEEHP